MIAIASQDGHALYALLDALEQDGFITHEAHLKRWRELQVRVKRTNCSAERVQLFELIRTMDRANQLEESWIKAYWPSIQAGATSAPNQDAFAKPERAPQNLSGGPNSVRGESADGQAAGPAPAQPSSARPIVST